MRIFRDIILLISITLWFFPSFSQDKIYMRIGTQSGKIININKDEIKFTNPKGTPSQVNLKDVFLIFNEKGGYLVPYRMDFNNAETKNSIDTFLHPTATARLTDYIYTADSKLIKANVIKEEKKFFMINDNGYKSNIDIKGIVAVIYKDGRHNLISPVITVADNLWAVYEEDQKNKPKVKPDVVKTTSGSSNTPMVSGVTEKAPVVKQKDVEVAKKPTVTESNPPVVPVPAATPVKKFEDVITDVSREEFEKKAIQKTNQLNGYLKVLCNKTSDYAERNKAVDLAVALFINEDATVQTSSLNSDIRNTYKIKKYLQAIKLYNYDRVDLEWTKIQYVSKLTKAPDGNFYGTISFEQVFRGFIDGKIAYEDITVKTGEVVLKAYQKIVDGISTEQWEVMLGDISVKTTKSL